MLAVAIGVAHAQPLERYRHQPFHERPADVARATALDLIAIRAEVLALPHLDPTDRRAIFDGATRTDLPLVRASLEELSAESAADLLSAVERLGKAIDTESGVETTVTELLQAVETARTVLFGSSSERDPVLAAAVAANLLVSQAGLAEFYEEATEGYPDEYAMAWAALARVKAIARPLATAMEASARSEFEETIERLEARISSPQAPAQFSGDPEEPEVFGHRIVALLEEAMNADLYLARDLPEAIRTVHELAASSCEDDRPEHAGETIAIAAFYFRDVLEDPLTLWAPNARKSAASAFETLSFNASNERLKACATLTAAFAEAKASLAPQASR